MVVLVLPLDPKHSMASTIFMPSFTLPKTTCLPSNHSVLAVQMKNWELFVMGPAFAMDKMPGPVCFRMKLLNFIIKFLPVDGLATSAIMACEVTTLTHKPWNNSVKEGNTYNPILSLQWSEHEFSAVFGNFSANCLKETQPKGSPSTTMLKNTVGFTMVDSTGLRQWCLQSQCCRF